MVLLASTAKECVRRRGKLSMEGGVCWEDQVTAIVIDATRTKAGRGRSTSRARTRVKDKSINTHPFEEKRIRKALETREREVERLPKTRLAKGRWSCWKEVGNKDDVQIVSKEVLRAYG